MRKMGVCPSLESCGGGVRLVFEFASFSNWGKVAGCVFDSCSSLPPSQTGAPTSSSPLESSRTRAVRLPTPPLPPSAAWHRRARTRVSRAPHQHLGGLTDPRASCSAASSGTRDGGAPVSLSVPTPPSRDPPHRPPPLPSRTLALATGSGGARGRCACRGATRVQSRKWLGAAVGGDGSVVDAARGGVCCVDDDRPVEELRDCLRVRIGRY